MNKIDREIESRMYWPSLSADWSMMRDMSDAVQLVRFGEGEESGKF
jgi:hypothetical protein